MPTYDKPTTNMQTAYDEARSKPRHNKRLVDVTIELEAKYASQNADGEPRSEALHSNGHPVPAKVKIMSLEDRSGENPSTDVRLVLHGDLWPKLSSQMQVSIFDTYLTRIQVELDEDGRTKRDDVGRPKLKKRPWEIQLFGFHEVAEDGGNHSLEVHNLRVMMDQHGQTYLPWLEGDSPVNIMAVAPRPKALAPDAEHKRGSLSAAALCEHLQHIDQPATVLGVAKLELQKKNPRKAVIKAVKDRVREMKILIDYIAVENGEDADVEIDLAAAVLVTTPKPSIALLDSMVPDCLDVKVLGWVLEGEGEESPREPVLEVVNSRIRELSP